MNLEAFPVSAVLCVIICALGEWPALAAPVNMCHYGTYYDPSTKGCEPCSLLCDQVRDSLEDCQEKCSDWLDRTSGTEPRFAASVAVWAVGGVGWLFTIILTVSAAIGHCKCKKKERKPNMEQHDDPKTRCPPKHLTADLHQMTDMQHGRPSSPIQVVADDTPFSPSNMRSIHADETTKHTDETTKPLLPVGELKNSDEATDQCQCQESKVP